MTYDTSTLIDIFLLQKRHLYLFIALRERERDEETKEEVLILRKRHIQPLLTQVTHSKQIGEFEIKQLTITGCVWSSVCVCVLSTTHTHSAPKKRTHDINNKLKWGLQMSTDKRWEERLCCWFNLNPFKHIDRSCCRGSVICRGRWCMEFSTGFAQQNTRLILSHQVLPYTVRHSSLIPLTYQTMISWLPKFKINFKLPAKKAFFTKEGRPINSEAHPDESFQASLRNRKSGRKLHFIWTLMTVFSLGLVSWRTAPYQDSDLVVKLYHRQGEALICSCGGVMEQD